ncbi:MAG: HAD-IIIC family phosphatase, partial [Bacteroidota bacterium]|nr:HAD-IIIC family phosphatase [Bacteroidota bacterium]
MRVALLSNVTVDLLASMLKKNHEVYLSAGFDTWQQEILLSSSGLYSYRPEAVVILLYSGAYSWEDKSSGFQLIDEWCSVLRSLSYNLPSTPVFISSIDVKENCHFGSDLRLERLFENYFIEQVEELHRQVANYYILPVKELVTRIGRDNFYSAKMWYVGSMPYSMKGLAEMDNLINRYISVTKGMHKKCIAVDLDNTLWGGVIGEDGVDGIILSEHKEGARYYDAQRLLKWMKNQGVMLAIISKNNTEDVEPIFGNPAMVLQHEDFVAEIINWEPKSANIRKLATTLNIGLDSFVFLDDNPAEREQMKAECPEVAVIEFPKDSSLLPETIIKMYYDYFLSLEV